MTNISSKLFNQQVMSSLKSLDHRIGELQNETSTGKRQLLASDDPMRVSSLNSSKDLLFKFDRFLGNVETANDRLQLSDIVMTSFEPLLARFSELNIQANNDTLNQSDRIAIRAEVEELRALVLDLANTRDTNGVAIFGGTAGDVAAFQYGTGGRVEYFGDQGKMSLAISDNKNVDTSISGYETFMRIDTAEGPKSVFDIIDSFSKSLEVAGNGVEEVDLSDQSAFLRFQLGDRPAIINLTIVHNNQEYSVSASVVNGHLDNLKANIDKLDLDISVALTGNTMSIANSDNATTALKSLSIDPLDNVSASSIKVEVNGEEFLQTNNSLSQSLSDFNDAISHVSVQHAKLGATIQAVSTQKDILQQFKMTVAEDVSELQDSDLAEVVTELKQLLLNKDAAQQVYAKLNQQTLFDFIR